MAKNIYDFDLVSVILVTYNGEEYAEKFCASLEKVAKVPLEVICVDNNSRDTSIDIIKKYFPEARVFTLSRNTGFSRAANFGAKNANGEYLFFLNQDMELAPDSITNLLKRARERKDVGLFGAKIKFGHHPELINSFGIAINRIGIAWDYGRGEKDSEKFSREREALGACGGALFVRRDIFLSLGGFDERFFMYGEDVDLGLRVIGAGYKAMAIPEAVVFHYKDIFWGDTRHFEFLDQKNRWRIVLKYFPPGVLRKAIKAGIRFDLISLFKFLARRDFLSFFFRVKAIIYIILRVPEIIRERAISNILSEKVPLLLEEGYDLPRVDAVHLREERKWTLAQKENLKEEFKRETLSSILRVLLLRGPEPRMVNDVCEVLKEIYPDAEVVMFVGDKRGADGFKGEILEFSNDRRYFLKFFLKIFRKFDLILVLRKDAVFKKILAVLSLPKASFTIDNHGNLKRIL